MYIVLIIIHFIVSLFLIISILLQAGRGGGLSSAFGSNQVESFLGTSGADFLQKITAVCAIAFLCTCLALAILSGHQKKSVVIGNKDIANQMQEAANKLQGIPANVPVQNQETLPQGVALDGAQANSVQ